MRTTATRSFRRARTTRCDSSDSICGQETRQTTSDQSESTPSLPDHQEILAKLAELGSRTKVWEDWLKPVYGIGGKARGLRMIGEAEAAQQQEEQE
jgi:hypothetical protein